MKTKKILISYGTRPEAIKFAPVIWEMISSSRFTPIVCVSGQHNELLESAHQSLGINPDFNLQIMKNDQSLEWIHSNVVSGVSALLEQGNYDYLLVQGDTSTAMASALAGYMQKIPVGHVEAGLRSGDNYDPYPEEGNRKIISQIADLHFAPTKTAMGNLVREGIDPGSIHVTGNTGIDTLRKVTEESEQNTPESLTAVDFSKKIITVTLHRRESFGVPLERIAKALRHVALELKSNVHLVVIVHLNPSVGRILNNTLDNIPEVSLITPLNYRDMVFLLDKSDIILTDSGGLQEEAAYLGKRVLVLREKTERVEGVETGGAILVGTEEAEITEQIRNALTDKPLPDNNRLIYGDGNAASRILNVLSIRLLTS